MSQLNGLLIEDKDTDELRKIIDRIEKNRKGTSSNLYKKIIEIGRIYDNDSKIKSLNFYDDLFVGEKSIFSTLSYLIEAFDKSFNKSKSQYKKFFTIKNIADFDNVKYVMSLHTSFYRFIKIASFLIMKLDPENLVGQKIKANDSNTENKTFSDSEKITNHLQQYFKIFAQYKKFFGSTIDEFTLVNILNSLETLASYPNEERPYDILLDLSCFSINGLIIPCSKDIFLIHLSERTLIIYFLIFF